MFGAANWLPIIQGGAGLLGIFDQLGIDARTREELMSNLASERTSVLGSLNKIATQGQIQGEAEKAQLANRYTSLGNLATSASNQSGLANLEGGAGVRSQVETQGALALSGLNERLKQYNTALRLAPIAARQMYGQEERGIISGERPQSPFLALSQLAGSLIPAPKPEEPEQDWFSPLIGASSSLGSAGIVAGALGGGGGGAALSMLPFAFSDRNLKENFRSVETLESLKRVPTYRYEFRQGQGQQGDHIGPTAQDFFDEFGLGNSDTTINVLDGVGVALTAIKELAEKVEHLEHELAKHVPA